MDQATLEVPDIESGLEALHVLDAACIKAVLAALMVFPEYEDWRLMLSSPALDQTHQLRALQQVTKALNRPLVRNLPLIYVLSMKDSFIRELLRLFGKAKSVAGKRLGGQTIDSRYISDGYVYRIR